MTDGDALLAAVRELDACAGRLFDAQRRYAAARQSVIDAASAAGVTARVVLVVGKTAWYIDPPGTTADRSDGWTVAYGSPPADAGQ